MLRATRRSAWDPDNPAFELVRCHYCNGTGRRDFEKRLGRRVERIIVSCRECSGTGEILRGDPPGSPYSITLDYTEETFRRWQQEQAGRA